MQKIRMTFSVVYELNMAHYPEGASPQEAMEIDIANAKESPQDFMEFDGLEVSGEIIVD